MISFYGDRVYVLGLKSNDNKKWRQRFIDYFGEEKLEFFMVDGVSSKINDGNENDNLWEIYKHNSTSAVSYDIFQNHIAIIRKAVSMNQKNIMILEEDTIFPDWNENKELRWKNTEEWLQKNDWDIFYLGYCNWPIPISFYRSKNIVKLMSPLCLHSYLLNYSGMTKILNHVENYEMDINIHIDKMMNQIPNFTKFGIYPMIGFQEKIPALFKRGCKKMNIDFSFTQFCKYNETISIIIPVVFILILMYYVISYLNF